LNKILLLGETKEKMLNELRGGKKTAKDLADVLQIQVSAARKHLEALSTLDIVREEFIQEGIGRPKKFYRLTEDGRELFPRQYERILCEILEKLKNSDGQASESLVKEVAHEISREINHVEHNNHTDVVTLVKALSDFGFDAALEETSTSFVITSHNCPLYKAAMKHQKIVCHSLHDEIIKSALDTRDVRLERCLTRGDNACRHVIEKRNL
jgi:DeoR family transcriptional regulator, suf operon transcriptional repressor